VPIEGRHQDDRFWIDGLPAAPLLRRFYGVAATSNTAVAVAEASGGPVGAPTPVSSVRRQRTEQRFR